MEIPLLEIRFLILIAVMVIYFIDQTKDKRIFNMIQPFSLVCLLFSWIIPHPATNISETASFFFIFSFLASSCFIKEFRGLGAYLFLIIVLISLYSKNVLIFFLSFNGSLFYLLLYALIKNKKECFDLIKKSCIINLTLLSTLFFFIIFLIVTQNTGDGSLHIRMLLSSLTNIQNIISITPLLSLFIIIILLIQSSFFPNHYFFLNIFKRSDNEFRIFILFLMGLGAFGCVRFLLPFKELLLSYEEIIYYFLILGTIYFSLSALLEKCLKSRLFYYAQINLCLIFIGAYVHEGGGVTPPLELFVVFLFNIFIFTFLLKFKVPSERLFKYLIFLFLLFFPPSLGFRGLMDTLTILIKYNNFMLISFLFSIIILPFVVRPFLGMDFYQKVKISRKEWAILIIFIFFNIIFGVYPKGINLI